LTSAFQFAAGQLMATEPLPQFELTLRHFEGLSPRSRNIGGALLCDRRFQPGMRAMTAVGTKRTSRAGLAMSVDLDGSEVRRHALASDLLRIAALKTEPKAARSARPGSLVRCTFAGAKLRRTRTIRTVQQKQPALIPNFALRNRIRLDSRP